MDKKVIVIVGVVVVVGAVIGLGVAGIVPIPGLTHAKAKKADADSKDDAKKDDKKPGADAADAKKLAADAGKKKADDDKKLAEDKKKAETPTPADLARGYKKLAGIWAEMKPEDVSALLVSHYKPEEAAPILKLMDEDQVAAIFTALSASAKAESTPGMAPKASQTAVYCDALAKEVSKPVLPDDAKA
jgi:flagellar motility protein MotE (MotC chaperone)